MEETSTGRIQIFVNGCGQFLYWREISSLSCLTMRDQMTINIDHFKGVKSMVCEGNIIRQLAFRQNSNSFFFYIVTANIFPAIFFLFCFCAFFVKNKLFMKLMVTSFERKVTVAIVVLKPDMKIKSCISDKEFYREISPTRGYV